MWKRKKQTYTLSQKTSGHIIWSRGVTTRGVPWYNWIWDVSYLARSLVFLRCGFHCTQAVWYDLCSRLHLRLNVAYCVARRYGKTINFHGYWTPRDLRGGSTDPFLDSLWSCLPKTITTQLPHAIDPFSPSDCLPLYLKLSHRLSNLFEDGDSLNLWPQDNFSVS